MTGWNDTQKGVELRPGYGNDVNVCYTGLLSQCGAEQVYLHCGFGDPQHWNNAQDQRMEHTARGWEKNVALQNNQMIFCFKDSANNWDNNSGHNWVFRA